MRASSRDAPGDHGARPAFSRPHPADAVAVAHEAAQNGGAP